MEHDLSIRRYEPADADDIWRIHERALRASPIEFVEGAPADRDLRTISETYLDGRGEFLVGLVQGEVVATGGYRTEDDETVELRRMRVDPAWQGRGLGTRFLAELERRASDDGFERATLVTNEDLRTARSLYETHGYEETDRRTDAETATTFVAYRKSL